MIRWLFRLWVGGRHPFYCYPIKWWRLKDWRHGRSLTKMSSYVYSVDKKRFTDLCVELIKYGHGVAHVPWPDEEKQH